MNIKLGDWVKAQLKSIYTRHLPPSYAEGIVIYIHPEGETMHILYNGLNRASVSVNDVIEHRPLEKNNEEL